MRKKFRITTVLILVLSMIIGMGFSSYRAEEPVEPIEQEEQIPGETSETNEQAEPVEPGEPVDPGEPVEPVEPVDPTEPKDPKDPIDPIDPTEPLDPDNPEDPADPDPVDPEDPNPGETPDPGEPNPGEGEPEPGEPEPGEPIPGEPTVPETPEMLPYTIIYYIDEEEMPEYQINDFVSAEIPIVKEVPELVIPNYIIDLEMSTYLPFTVTEDDNIIEVYYILAPVNRISPFALNLYYESDTPIMPLHDTSNNDHTKTKYAWMYDGDLYLALYSHPQHPISYIRYDGELVAHKSIDRASITNDSLTISRIGYPDEVYAIDPDAKNPKPLWTVVNLGSGYTLSSKFVLYIGTDATGHDVKNTTVYTKNSLLVYHSYEGGPTILDVNQSGGLNSSLGYSVEPEYVYDGDTYELDYIEVIHNGIFQGYKYPSDLVAGYLSDTVIPDSFNASAQINFYYKRIADGKLTITKYVTGTGYDSSQEFDIFIYGPKNKIYVVTLRDGESETIENLEYGEYIIEEIVPMNYELEGMSDTSVTISRIKKEESVTVTNRRTNDGWFYDDDERINSFHVGITTTSTEVENYLGYNHFNKEAILPEEITYKKRVLI